MLGSAQRARLEARTALLQAFFHSASNFLTASEAGVFWFPSVLRGRGFLSPVRRSAVAYKTASRWISIFWPTPFRFS